MVNYYDTAKKASQEIGNHSGLKILKSRCESAGRVLDVGCGEGTRLHTLLPPGKNGWGVDISLQAITRAKKQYPGHHFSVSDAAGLPFSDNYFDLVYSAFTLEHTTNPQLVISEMFRVTRPGGLVIILCPNFGAPNRRSPVSAQSPLSKLISGFYRDFFPSKSLRWQFVTPKKSYDRIDDDTTVEPYLHSLLLYLSGLRIKIISASPVWDQELPSLNPRKLFITILGKIGMFPFKYWGPQIFIVALK